MILGMLRVKNEARWIERCLASIHPLCDQILVMDDHSEDDTATRCIKFPYVSVYPSPFTGLQEQRDKNWLLEKAVALNPEWIIAIDGDEMLVPGHIDQFKAALNTPATCFTLPVLYLWDSEDQYRVDGVYGNFHRESVFRPNGARFTSNSNGGNFHCGNVPWAIRQNRQLLDIPLLHFGYMHREDRVRKYAWYNANDPGNTLEDHYRHMVVGDIFPADSRFMHGGPLHLERLGVPA